MLRLLNKFLKSLITTMVAMTLLAFSTAYASSESAQVKDPIKTAEKSNDKLPEKNLTTSDNSQTDKADIAVVEFVLANQVDSREPKIVEAFTKEDQRAFAFARLNVKATDDVTFIWTRDGHEMNRTTLPVHMAQKWRTYSSIKLRSGNWKVQLLSKNQVLAEKTFTVE